MWKALCWLEKQGNSARNSVPKSRRALSNSIQRVLCVNAAVPLDWVCAVLVSECSAFRRHSLKAWSRRKQGKWHRFTSLLARVQASVQASPEFGQSASVKVVPVARTAAAWAKVSRMLQPRLRTWVRQMGTGSMKSLPHSEATTLTCVSQLGVQRMQMDPEGIACSLASLQAVHITYDGAIRLDIAKVSSLRPLFEQFAPTHKACGVSLSKLNPWNPRNRDPTSSVNRRPITRTHPLGPLQFSPFQRRVFAPRLGYGNWAGNVLGTWCPRPASLGMWTNVPMPADCHQSKATCVEPLSLAGCESRLVKASRCFKRSHQSTRGGNLHPLALREKKPRSKRPSPSNIRSKRIRKSRLRQRGYDDKRRLSRF